MVAVLTLGNVCQLWSSLNRLDLIVIVISFDPLIFNSKYSNSQLLSFFQELFSCPHGELNIIKRLSLFIKWFKWMSFKITWSGFKVHTMNGSLVWCVLDTCVNQNISEQGNSCVYSLKSPADLVKFSSHFVTVGTPLFSGRAFKVQFVYNQRRRSKTKIEIFWLLKKTLQ